MHGYVCQSQIMLHRISSLTIELLQTGDLCNHWHYLHGDLAFYPRQIKFTANNTGDNIIFSTDYLIWAGCPDVCRQCLHQMQSCFGSSKLQLYQCRDRDKLEPCWHYISVHWIFNWIFKKVFYPKQKTIFNLHTVHDSLSTNTQPKLK